MMIPQKLGSDRDPSGVLFQVEGRLLRGIHSQFADYYRSVFNAPVLQKNIGRKIVDTRISDQTLPGYPLVFEHRKIFPLSYCYSWPLQMLKDAARLALDLCLELNQDGWVLKDATPWNILYDGPTPFWVDITSIKPQDPNLPWEAYDQFCRYFLFPLLIGESSGGNACRAALLYAAAGITPAEASRYLPAAAWIRHFWLIKRLYSPRMMVALIQKSEQAAAFRAYSQNASFSPVARQAFFENLDRDVESIQTAPNRSYWSHYYRDLQNFFHPDLFHLKQKRIAEILERCQPYTVVDLGCNQGGYSILAALRGARVTALDLDEDCVTSLYHLTRERKLNILSLVGDVVHPSPASGWRGIELQSGQARFRSQMAFALALVHHLAISQMQSFERIVKSLSEFCERWLVVEFVPPEDPRVRELLLTNRNDNSWYTFDHFLQALKTEFRQVDTFPSFPEGRTLCFCEK